MRPATEQLIAPAFLFIVFLAATPLFACEFNTDCSPGSECLKSSG